MGLSSSSLVVVVANLCRVADSRDEGGDNEEGVGIVLAKMSSRYKRSRKKTK